MVTSNAVGATQPLNKVSAIDLISTSAGAVSGFPVIKGVDLNKPGWINDTSTNYACLIVLQVKFTLSGISSSNVDLRRMIVRTATVQGPNGQIQGTKMGPNNTPTSDGPSPPTVVVPNSSSIAVSDDPGFQGGGQKVFPITYHANFDVYAFALDTKAILAKVSYVIDIQKQSFGDASPTQTLSNIVKTIY